MIAFLFGGQYDGPYPWFTGGDPLVRKDWYALKQKMREFGFAVDPSSNELEDHVSVLLEFCAKLISEYMGKNREDNETSVRYLSLLNHIIEGYLGNMAQQFSSNINLDARFEFYKAAGVVLKNFIRFADSVFQQLLNYSLEKH